MRLKVGGAAGGCLLPEDINGQSCEQAWPHQSSTTVNRTNQAEQSQEWGSTAGILPTGTGMGVGAYGVANTHAKRRHIYTLTQRTHTRTPCSLHLMTHAHEVRWSFVVTFHTSKVSAMPFGLSGLSGSRVRWVVRPMREHCPSCVDAYAKAHSPIKVESKRTSIVCQ